MGDDLVNFFWQYLVSTCPFIGPLILLFWTSGNSPYGLQTRVGNIIHISQRHMWCTFTSGAKPANLLMVSIITLKGLSGYRIWIDWLSLVTNRIYSTKSKTFIVFFQIFFANCMNDTVIKISSNPILAKCSSSLQKSMLKLCKIMQKIRFFTNEIRILYQNLFWNEFV